MRPISATIDLGALRANLAVARRHAPRSRAFAVVKADAYGHGLLRTARALREADGYALLELDAAVRLREAGCRQRIVLLEGFFDERDLKALAGHRIGSVIHNAEQIRMLAQLPPGSGFDVLLKLNTGMNRLGFPPADLPTMLAALRDNPAIGQITLMTHFANADDARGVAWQMATLEHAAAGVVLPRCLANSAAILRYPETHFDWVRPGIMLYGCSPFAETPVAALGLKPAMTLASAIIAVQNRRCGDTVGYGGMFCADRPMRIGVVACGYADGYPRHAPNGTPVRVGDAMTGTVGRVSMDKLCVDISGLPAAGIGTPVVLWGEGNPVDDVAQAAGTVSYELLCALAARVPVTGRS
ncbi:MAG: alanine racemase [Burkholderiales bacterium]|nr:alanine racemase [Burkholderiales bacterium]